METYLVLNLIFLAIVVAILALLRTLVISRLTLIAAAILLVLTAIFDSIIIGLGIVGYDMDKILGVMIFNAPVEDFFYTLLVIIAVPSLWKLIGNIRHAKNV